MFLFRFFIIFVFDLFPIVMAKLLYYTLAHFLLLLPFSLFSQTDIQKLKLHGKVKFYKEITIRDYTIPEDICDYYVSFDEYGNKVGETDYKDYGIINGSHSYDYDSAGNLLEMNVFNEDGTLYSNFKYRYDSQGRLKEKRVNYASSGYPMRYTYIYDRNGRLSQEIDYDMDGNRFKSFSYRYDTQGNLTEEKFYLPFGVLYNRTTFEYDGKGNLICVRHYDQEDFMFRRILFKYDENGNPVEENKCQFRGRSLCEEVYRYEYEYDRQGNWVKKKVFGKDNSLSVVQREIEYY